MAGRTGHGKRALRSGYTTGACAAAASKAAMLLLLGALSRDRLSIGMEAPAALTNVDIPFPDGSRVKFRVESPELGERESGLFAAASVIKDAGDDPDATHGAEIRAEVKLESAPAPSASAGSESGRYITIRGGSGVGVVTKPGLPIPVGEPAINPVPRRMIREAVAEAAEVIRDTVFNVRNMGVEVTISVKDGTELAKKTLNSRLGIVGGISILGTTGIVRPLSDDAWTATISSSMDVASAMGREEIVLSTGRTSEKAHQKRYGLPEESYVMMGDYVEFALKEAGNRRFEKIYLCAQWAKMIKIAMGVAQTHVRHGALEADAAEEFLIGLGLDIFGGRKFNTTRGIYDFIISESNDPLFAFMLVCRRARHACEKAAGGAPVRVCLVSYEGEIIAEA